MIYLLDVNVLIALIDPSHVSHDSAHDWFAQEGAASWATCPITQNGLVRIVSHPRYPNGVATPRDALRLLKELTELPGHVFWSDDLSLTDPRWLRPDHLLNSGQVTDSYLLALAARNGGKLATLDRRLSTLAVTDGFASLKIIDARR